MRFQSASGNPLHCAAAITAALERRETLIDGTRVDQGAS